MYFSWSYKAQFGLAIKIYTVWIFILNSSAIWLVNTKPQNKEMHFRFSPRRTCNQHGYTKKISSRYRRLLIHDEKTAALIDGRGPLHMLIFWTYVQVCSINFTHFCCEYSVIYFNNVDHADD